MKGDTILHCSAGRYYTSLKLTIFQQSEISANYTGYFTLCTCPRTLNSLHSKMTLEFSSPPNLESSSVIRVLQQCVIVLHSSLVKCSVVQCSSVQFSAVQSNALQCGTVQCSLAQFSAVQCSSVQFSAVQCSSV